MKSQSFPHSRRQFLSRLTAGAAGVASITQLNTKTAGLSRRCFLQAAAAGAAVSLAGCAFKTSDGWSPGAKNPLLRFVQLNDTHVSATPATTYALANEKLDYLIGAINAGTHRPVPDFVLGIGDLVHGGSLASLAPDFAVLRPKLAQLQRPFHPVMGNHENVQREGDPEYEAAYVAAFGAERVNYTFLVGSMRFVVLNNSGAPASNRQSAGRARNRWLRGVLESSSPTPVILCCHIPLVPVREEAVLKRSFGFGSYVAHDDELLELVDAHADRIVAVLSGHLHLTGVVQRHGVHHIVVSGPASYPCDFASYELFADRLRGRMHSLPPELLTPATNIHGQRRHKTDYTDVNHAMPELYIRGNPQERDFEIRLGGSKRPLLATNPGALAHGISRQCGKPR